MVQEMVKRVLDLQDILEVIGEFSKVRDEFLRQEGCSGNLGSL